MNNGNVICLFSRYPAAGRAQSRLEDFLGKKQAAFLVRAFLMDTLATSLRVDGSDLYLAHIPDDFTPEFKDFIYLFASEERDRSIARMAESINLVPLHDGDFESHLSASSRFLFEQGAKKAIFVGSGSPLIQPIVLRACFELLTEKQVVVGPTFYGGYYLIGCDKHYPGLFEGVCWNSSSVYRETVAKLTADNLTWQELELSYDVDGPDELEQLYRDIDNLRLTGENDIGYHTEKCLQNLEK